MAGVVKELMADKPEPEFTYIAHVDLSKWL